MSTCLGVITSFRHFNVYVVLQADKITCLKSTGIAMYFTWQTFRWLTPATALCKQILHTDFLLLCPELSICMPCFRRCHEATYNVVWSAAKHVWSSCVHLCVQIPIGAEDRFEGVVDLVRMKGITWDGEVSPAHKSCSSSHFTAVHIHTDRSTKFCIMTCAVMLGSFRGRNHTGI